MLLRQIEYFQSVVRNNSFTLAAEDHHISQSAISQQIRALEGEPGVELATHNPLSQLPEVEIADLRQLPCILVASKEQQEEERRYYRDIVGFNGL